MSVAVGLRVMAEMMEDELTAKVGPKHAKVAQRKASRHGTAPGSVVLGGRRVKAERPRARTADRHRGGPRHLAFADDDLHGGPEADRCHGAPGTDSADGCERLMGVP